jgi:hypothetical protein
MPQAATVVLTVWPRSNIAQTRFFSSEVRSVLRPRFGSSAFSPFATAVLALMCFDDALPLLMLLVVIRFSAVLR